MEELIEKLQQRITDLERRFYPIEDFLYQTNEKEIESLKSKQIDNEGVSYMVEYVLETDKGIKEVKIKVKAFSEKQAMFIGNRDVIFPQMSRLVKEGKINWFKTKDKKIVNNKNK